MADWWEVRASGADRERAADLLRTAHADGTLPWQDYSARLEGLMTASTHGDLHRIVGDLADDPGPTPAAGAGSPDARGDLPPRTPGASSGRGTHGGPGAHSGPGGTEPGEPPLAARPPDRAGSATAGGSEAPGPAPSGPGTGQASGPGSDQGASGPGGVVPPSSAYAAQHPHGRPPGAPARGGFPPPGPASARGRADAGAASPGPVAPGTTDRMASAALLCGVLVPFTVGLSGIPAILLGVLVRRRLASAGEQAPRQPHTPQMATAAIGFGVFPIVLGLAVLLYVLGS